MFEYIKGTLIQLTPTTAVIDVAGVGWFVNISVQTSSELAGIGTGNEVKLLLHQYYAQDQAPVMYGFASEDERDMFRLLISVNGIGASTARIMLSTYNPSQLSSYISSGNVRAIQKTKGIGQRTSERLVVELKGKVKNYGDSPSGQTMLSSQTEDEAISALTILGFPKASAEKVVHKVFATDKSLSVEDLIRKSLAEF